MYYSFHPLSETAKVLQSNVMAVLLNAAAGTDEELYIYEKQMKGIHMEFQHGGDIYHNKIEYDFSANINPLGMPKGCVEAVIHAVSHIGEYPDNQGEALCRAVATAEDVDTAQVILGNGAAELIYTLCYALGPKRAIALAPTFSEYENAVKAAGGGMEFWNLEAGDGFQLRNLSKTDLDGVLEAGKKGKTGLLDMIAEDTDILFLCNPNNPTGAVVQKKHLLAIAKKCELTGTYLCVDECFLPFLEKEKDYTLKNDLKVFPHLLVLRAFTKVYAMPGLRLGYALTANRQLSEKMRQCLPPWNTSVVAQAAGEEALKDREFVKQTQQIIRGEKMYLMKELQNGLAQEIYASEANFIFFRSRPDLQKRLLEKRVLIRDCSNYRNLQEGYFRIAVRSHAENEELIRRWREL